MWSLCSKNYFLYLGTTPVEWSLGRLWRFVHVIGLINILKRQTKNRIKLIRKVILAEFWETEGWRLEWQANEREARWVYWEKVLVTLQNLDKNYGAGQWWPQLWSQHFIGRSSALESHSVKSSLFLYKINTFKSVDLLSLYRL